MFLCVLNVKEIPQHGHQQRLAKAPWPCKERDLRCVPQERPNDGRLVNKIKPLPYLSKIIPANRHRCVHRVHLLVKHI